ncbi:MAG: hypothetical protein JNG85_15485, partial [Spirochaetaceae bacterium]|nr:hypothetical protein [Spirochaetaceae bacterium]
MKRAFGVTLLYIGIFVLLVLAQFSRAPGFSFKSGRLSVTAGYSKTEESRPVSARLSYAGLSFVIDEETPAYFVDESGVARKASLRGIERLPSGARVLFAGGAEIRVLAAQAPAEGFSLTAVPPAEGAAALRLSYTLSSRSRFEEKGSRLLLESNGGPYELSLPARSFDRSAGYLRLEARGGALRGLSLAKAAAPDKAGSARPADQFIAQAPKDPAAFKAGIDAWTAKAWSGLAGSRWDGERLAWKDKDGTPRFSENALAAYLAESYRRGSYAEGLARGRAIREVRSAELSHLTVPFLGDTIRKMQALEAADLIEVKRISALIQAQDPSLFEKQGLVHFLMDRSPYSLAQEALRYAATLDPAKLTVRQAVGVLACAAESRSYLSDAENPFKALGSAADRLVTSLKKTQDGFFLVDEEGNVDFRLSLLAGVAFAEYGAGEGKELLVGVGQSLVEGVLGLADEQGFVPARAAVAAGALGERTGSLAPEELYAIVAANPYYPREISFYRDVAPGVWAWTCAPSLKVDATPSRYLFSANFPVGRAHYMAFYGVKPFTNIKLYDIDYSPDAEFEIYDVSGYFYRKAS